MSETGWQSTLELRYRAGERGRTVARFRHEGSLRVLAALYPEGESVCHQVLVHPPGGLVGGDTMDIGLTVETGAHALVTTPGATRFYRSLGAPACQRVRASVDDGARLEWLPLETLAFDACLARNEARFGLAPGAEMIGWDMLALGLPAAGKDFQRGSITQHIEIPGIWLDRARLEAGDDALLRSPAGLAGHTAMATAWFASGTALDDDRAEALLAAARDVLGEAETVVRAGASRPNPHVVVVRALGDRIEPLQQILQQVWGRWRMQAWALPACAPRVWRT